MGKVFVDLGISVDGCIAGPNRAPKNAMGDGGYTIHQWVFPLKAFRERLTWGDDGIVNNDNKLIKKVFERTGAYIMGNRMFEEGEVNWPENAPFRAPVFVLTKSIRELWQRPGGTVFHFVNESIENTLEKAKEAAGDKDIRISGGADVVIQYLNAGLVDELILHIAPVFIGQGLRLFDNIDKEKITLEIDGVISSPMVTHVTYKVKNSKK